MKNPVRHLSTSCRRQAAEWVEYVHATGGEPFLWPGEMKLSYVQLALLDMMAMAAILCMAALGVTLILGRRCLRRSVRVKRSKPSSGKKLA